MDPFRQARGAQHILTTTSLPHSIASKAEKYHRIRYTNLLTSCTLTAYLADIDEEATEMFNRLVKQLARKEGVTEHLKGEDQLLWVKRMNNIRNRAEEIVNNELIYE